MKGKPGKMLKLMRGSARSSGPGDQLSVIGRMTQDSRLRPLRKSPVRSRYPGRQARPAGSVRAIA